ncbi:hypothetical protein [Peribacillus sp. NPDC058075]|uniref:hypothetical protein n=1 Tax=unclassified Peribacillus TaxID=2675266 RepID=UPI0036DBDFC3
MTAITGLRFSTFYTGLSIPVAAVEHPDQPIPKEESVSIVQLVVPNDKAKDKLLELGIDLTHRIEAHDGVYEVDAVVTAREIEMNWMLDDILLHIRTMRFLKHDDITRTSRI